MTEATTLESTRDPETSPETAKPPISDIELMNDTDPVTDVTSAANGNLDIPLESIIGLYLQNVSQSEIARRFGCTQANISRRLQSHKEEFDALPDFKKHRADIMAMIQRRIINTLTKDDIKKQSAYQRVGMYSILYDKERLERELSTEIVSHDVLLSAASDKRQAYEDAVRKRLEDDAA